MRYTYTDRNRKIFPVRNHIAAKPDTAIESKSMDFTPRKVPIMSKQPSALSSLLELSPVIAAVRQTETLSAACTAQPEILFLLHATVSDVASRVSTAKAAGKCVFLHADLIEGLSADSAAMRYLRSTTAADGIISTRSGVIRAAKDCGFLTVQRFFVVDSQAEETVLRTVSQTTPDCVELMPGIIPTVISRLSAKLSLPVIAGGLVETKEQVVSLLSAGACGVSTSCPELWNI